MKMSKPVVKNDCGGEKNIFSCPQRCRRRLFFSKKWQIDEKSDNENEKSVKNTKNVIKTTFFEVAFIVAGIGLAFEVLSDEIYSTVIFVILTTIFIAPILLKNSFSILSES